MKLLKLILVCLVLSCASSAHAGSLSNHQKAFIDRFLAEHDLNIYGDPEGTLYMGGSPLFDESTGQCMDRYEYVLRHNPHILDTMTRSFGVDTLPVEGVDPVLVATRRLANDFDASRVAGRTLSTSALRESEEAIQALVESVAVAVEARDYKAIAGLFDRVGQLTNAELKPFATVFKQARRMLSMPSIQPIELTVEINALLAALDRLEARL